MKRIAVAATLAARASVCVLMLACAPAWAVPKQKTIAVDNASGGSVAGQCTLAQAIVAANKDDNPGDATHPYGNTPPGATTLDPLGDSVATVAATDTAPANHVANGCALIVTDATSVNRTEYLIDLGQVAGQTITFDPNSGIYPTQGWNANIGIRVGGGRYVDGDKADNYWYGPNALPPIASKITLVGHGATLQVAEATRRLRFFFVGADALSQATPGYNTPGAGYLTLRNLTLRGGRQLGGAGANGGAGAGMGGAIFNQGAVSLEATTFTNNWATGGDSYNGDYAIFGTGGGMGSGGGPSAGGGMGGPVPHSTTTRLNARFTGLAGLGADYVSTPHVALISLRGDGGAAGDIVDWSDGGTYAGGNGGGFDGGPGTQGLVDYVNDNQGWIPLAGVFGGAIGSNATGSPFTGSGGGVGGGSSLGGAGGFGGGGNVWYGDCAYCDSSGFGGGGLTPGFGGEVGGGGGFGGAIFNFAGEVDLINVTLTGNQARGGRNHDDENPPAYFGVDGDGYGSAIFNLNGLVTAAFSTIAGNQVTGTKATGAIYSLGYNANPVDSSDPDWLGSKTASLWLANSIVSGTVANGATAAFDVIVNAPPKVGPTDNPPFDNHAISDYQDFGYPNLIGRSTINGAITLGDVNPKLRSLAVNLPPGTTSPPTYVPPTMALPSNSPASGQGDCGTPFYNPPGGVDERGAPRPTSGVACDLGAFQLQPGEPVAILVNTEQDYPLNVAANTSDGLCSLREAIDNANSGSPMRPDCSAGNSVRNLVQFAPNVKHIVVSLAAGGNMPIGGHTTIDGGSAGVTLDGNGATRIFSMSTGQTATLQALNFVNASSGTGGAVENYGTLDVTDSSFSGNTGTQGGALFNGAPGTLMVTNGTFSGNTASSTGGGVYTAGGAITTLRHATVANNNGGGVGNAGTLNLQGSLIANNTGGNCNGTFTDVGSNLAWGDPSCTGLAAGDPNLGPLQDNGGPTPTMLPGMGSAAVDAIPCDTDMTVDQRGVARAQGPRCDAGAVEVREFQLTVNVTTANGSVATTSPANTTQIAACTNLGGTCSAWYPAEESVPVTVTLTAAPAIGYQLSSWGGDCFGLTASTAYVRMWAAGRTCTAAFEVDDVIFSNGFEP